VTRFVGAHLTLFAVILAVQVICCVALVVTGGVLLFIGWRGVRGQLAPNRYAGVRTPATLRSDQAFEIGNRAAGPAFIGAGAVWFIAGISLPMLPGWSTVLLVAVLGALGGFVLMAVGGVMGNRAAAALPEPTSSGCAGCACGCCSALERG
jgi:hypothetical protein